MFGYMTEIETVDMVTTEEIAAEGGHRSYTACFFYFYELCKTVFIAVAPLFRSYKQTFSSAFPVGILRSFLPVPADPACRWMKQKLHCEPSF